MSSIEQTTVNIEEIVRDHGRIQIRTQTSAETVERYADSLEHLPPVDIFRVRMPAELDDAGELVKPERDELVLADGFHRVAAYEAMKKTTIPANVRPGTLEEAAEFAAVANATSGKALSIDERNAAIRRLYSIHGRSMNQGDIAARLSVSQPLVSRVLRMDKLRADNAVASSLSDAHLSEIMAAPSDNQAKLIAAAYKHKWTRAQTRTAIKNLTDEKVDAATWRDVLSGAIEPVKVKRDGSFERVVPGSEPTPEDVWEPVRVALVWLLDAEVSDVVESLTPEILGQLASKVGESLELAAEVAAAERDSADGGDDAAS